MAEHPSPRDRRPTLADVATAAGVSVALVSIVMRESPGASDSTRERVKQIADSLGYRPDQRARLLRQQRSKLLGVTFDIEQAFHGDLVDGLYAAAEPAGYEIVLSAITGSRDEATAIRAVLADRCEALILLGPRASARELTGLVTKLPTVVVARKVTTPQVDCVRTDDAGGAHDAIAHLAALGHHRIAYLDGRNAAGAADRRRAVASAGAAATIDLRVLPSGSTEEDGVASAHHLLDQIPDTTAVIAFNDRCAMGVVDAFLRAGVRVPEDISVVGYDDSRLSRISYLNLTTVGQNPAELAAVAVQRAIDRLEDRPCRPRDQVITPELIIRRSTGPARSTLDTLPVNRYFSSDR